MKITEKRRMSTEKMVLMALFTALVVVFTLFGSAIPIGGTPLNFSLVPVVLGAALCGPFAGGFFGGVSAVTILLSGQANAFVAISIWGTIFIVLAKGILSGLAAGLIYKIIERRNKYLAVVVSAVVVPTVNTGIFVVGCFLFFYGGLSEWVNDGSSVAFYILFALAGINYITELIINMVLAPTVTRIIDIAKKKNTIKSK